MSSRELVVLGTASQAPTRHRNHNGYLLRWDTEGVLFDPGEGTQRQMTLAGLAASSITRICVTHFHGDHCLGLPGVIQRLSLDRVTHPVPVCFPAAGLPFFERLRRASAFDETADVRAVPVAADGPVAGAAPAPTAAGAAPAPTAAGAAVPPPPLRLLARHLDHRTPTLGWRLEEADARRILPERLQAAGVHGPDIGRLQRNGAIDVGARRVTLEEVSEPRRGQSFAFVMDTRMCDAAVELAAGVDMLVCESTFLAGEEHLAAAYGHLTAGQAARIAAEAGARLLVLTHFSQRHVDEEAFVAEAKAIFPDVIAARDLTRIPLPSRR